MVECCKSTELISNVTGVAGEMRV